MEPKIGDFGLERLVVGDTSYKAGGSARNFGSKRSTASRDSFQETTGLGPSPSPSPSSIGGISPYHAPESLRTLKPSPKWDVYSFGVILLELLSGKIVVVDELGQANGVVVDDHNRAMRMVDVAIRGDLEGKEEALLALLKLGFSCASPIPQKRPPIKEALHILEKIPLTFSSSSSTSFYYGHSWWVVEEDSEGIVYVWMVDWQNFTKNVCCIVFPPFTLGIMKKLRVEITLSFWSVIRF